MSTSSLRVGLCGVGTVGLATVHILRDQSAMLAARCGQTLSITHVGARREVPHSDYATARISRDVMDVARDPDVDVLVELIGGTTVARDLIKLAIEQGKHVVTANKALIAEHGNELILLAEQALAPRGGLIHCRVPQSAPYWPSQRAYLARWPV